ncbi:extracellular solute-binding protein [Plantibacter sp. Mn2098]|uniref:extracellular solute-binding protein n=1 Tax=Plantibacter sp. Mn2098 TaxID=3395266 RepID=UPI003BCB6327
MSNRNRAVAVGVVASTAALALAGCSITGVTSSSGGDAATGTVNAIFATDAGYTEDNINSMIASFEKANPKITVKPTFVTYNALHDKEVTAAPTGSYDIVHMDVVWPAEFAKAGIIADVTDRVPKSWSEDMLGGALDSAKYDGKWYGVPWEPSSKLLFFNTALLASVGASPADLDSWQDVLAVAKRIKEAGTVKYPISWSWSQSEALVCDFAQLLGSFGGSFFDSSGKLDINSPQAVQTVEWMKSTIDDGLTDPASLSFVEDDVNKSLAAGRSAIGLNWNSTFSALQDASQSVSAGSIGVLPTPVGPTGSRKSVNGSMALAITESSKVKTAAWKFIEYATSQQVQDAFIGSSPSNWKSSYTDPAVVKTNPALISASGDAYNSMILRPQVANYNSVSQALQVALQSALLGQKTPQTALDDAARDIAGLK